MSDKHPIDELFKRQLEQHSIKPSEAAWSKIEAATQRKSSGFKPMYLMRAAVVTLLIGVSGWVYFQSNSTAVVKPIQPVEMPVLSNHKGSPNNTPKAATSEPTETPQQQPTKEPEEPQKEQPAAGTKKVPVMKMSSGSGNRKVFATSGAIAAVEEEAPLELISGEEKLDPTRVAEAYQPKMKFKLHINKPVSEDWADESESQKEAQMGLKDKVFAYASNQFENIKAGKKLELPKAPKGKPQFEINLDKLF
jgi:hypothetical protein